MRMRMVFMSPGGRAHLKSKLMTNLHYCVVYTSNGSYLALADEVDIKPSEFWKGVRTGIAAVVALPLTALSYLL